MAVIRDAKEADFAAIVEINRAEEQQTSAMSLERLKDLHAWSGYHRVAEVNGQVAGFLLVMRESAPYPNINFDWFAARYPQFLYIDRIVVSAEYAGMRIGSALYQDLFAFAKSHAVKNVLCEYNIEPPNLASKAFHDGFGFKQVGSHRVQNDTKLVSLQAAQTD